MWVSSSSVYPQIRPGEIPDDTVTILDDTDGDGVADVSRVFSAGLHMPTAVLPGDGGCYVANATEMLHLADTDGDGTADTRRTVLSGFGTEDTHHLIHTFRWGVDSRLFFNQSIYIHSHVETPAGVRRLNGGGMWRFRPSTLDLGIFARGWVNPWGHAIDPWGRSLVTDGAGGEGINLGFPGAAYVMAVGTPRILHGMNPGSPKLCGLEILSGAHLPDDAQGVLVTHDFRANRVCRYRLTESGSGFTSERLPDLIRSPPICRLGDFLGARRHPLRPGPSRRRCKGPRCPCRPDDSRSDRPRRDRRRHRGTGGSRWGADDAGRVLSRPGLPRRPGARW
jgi:hypothetical protein